MALNGSIVITTKVDTAQAENNLKGLVVGIKTVEKEQVAAAKAAEEHALQMQRVADVSRTAAIGLGVFGAALGAAAIGSIKLAADMEQSRVAFTTLLGSGEKARKFLDELAVFAASTPFEFVELQDASRRLLAFGFNAKDIIPIMNSVGGAAAGLGLGKEGIDRMTLALGQMQAKGKVSAQEMNQLAEAGVPGWEILAKAIGVGIPEAMKLGEKGAIDSTTAINALINGLNTKFPGMLEKQSQTINGQLSNLRDGVTLTATLIGEKLISAFHITDAVRAAAEAVSGFGRMIKAGGLKEAIDAAFPPGLQMIVVGIAGALTATLVPALGSVAVAFGSAALAAAPLLGAGAGIAGAAYLIIKNWEPISGFFETIFNGIADMATNVRDWIVSAFQAAIGKVREAIMAVMNFFRPIVEKLIDALPPALRGQLSGVLAWTKTAVGGVVETVGSGLSKTAANVGAGVKKVATGLVSGIKNAAGLIIPDLQKIMNTTVTTVANTAFTGLTGKPGAKSGAGGSAPGGTGGGAIQGPDLSGELRRKALEKAEQDQLASAQRVADSQKKLDEAALKDAERMRDQEIAYLEQVSRERERIEREAQQRTATGLREAYGVALNLLRGDFEGVATFIRGKVEDGLVNALSNSPAVQGAISQLGAAFTGPLGIAALFGSLLISSVLSAGDQARKIVNQIATTAEEADRIINPEKYRNENPEFVRVKTALDKAIDAQSAAEDAIVNFQKSPAFYLDAIMGGGQMKELRDALTTAKNTVTGLSGTLATIPQKLTPGQPGYIGLNLPTFTPTQPVTPNIPITPAIPRPAPETKPAAMPGETPDKPIYTQVVNVRDFRDAFPDSAYFRAPSVDTTRSLNANAVAYR